MSRYYSTSHGDKMPAHEAVDLFMLRFDVTRSEACYMLETDGGDASYRVDELRSRSEAFAAEIFERVSRYYA